MKATNKALLVDASYAGWLASTGFAQFTPKLAGNHAGFLFYVLSSPRFLAAKDARCVGSTQQAISDQELAGIPLRVPPIVEQEKIAEVLAALDTNIRQTEAIVEKLKQVKQGLLHDLLTRGIDDNGELRPPRWEAPQLYKDSAIGWIPRPWGMQSLGELAAVGRGKFTHRPRNDPRFYGGGYPFIQTGDVAKAAGGYISEHSQSLSERGTLASQEFPVGTIAITIAANIADTAILAVPMYFPDSVVGAIVSESMNVRFVELWIRRTKPMLDARAPQSAQKNINLRDLRPLAVAVPSRQEQDAIACVYEAARGRLEAETGVAETLRRLKAGLMDDLLTGRVRVTPLLASAET
ncbi:MAG: restriction endonuclease subunit S [Chromatiales bacterium]|nr:restriction endonuclease subunit S [Chromatiales bacterium]